MDVINFAVFSERAIDIGLNLVGYLSAGLVWALILETIRNRNQKRNHIESPAPVITTESVETSKKKSPAQNLEFIGLKSTSSIEEATSSNPASFTEESGRRNRGEMIRIAGEMLRNGVSSDRVQSLLPISKGEIALLAKRNH